MPDFHIGVPDCLRVEPLSGVPDPALPLRKQSSTIKAPPPTPLSQSP